MDQLRHAGGEHGSDDGPGPSDVEPLQVVHVVGRLEAPRQVHHGVHAREGRRESWPGVVGRQVERMPPGGGVRAVLAGRSAGDPDDVVVVAEQGPDQRRTDVATGTGDCDPHGRQVPSIGNARES